MTIELTDEEKSWMEDKTVEILEEHYRFWSERRARYMKEPVLACNIENTAPEPKLTAKDIRDELAMRATYRSQKNFHFMTRRCKYRVTYQMLERLKRQGRIGSSLGSTKGRQEVRCWEPADVEKYLNS